MTQKEFRRLALSLPLAIEAKHQDHPDFRVGGKIFATMGYPDKAWGMVKLTPMLQQSLVRSEPEVFVPVKGTWGLRGATSVLLRRARKAILYAALTNAWRNAAPKRLTRQIDITETIDHVGPTKR
jgi:hypothetical protein